jgi:uncharacterized membrane protein
LKEIIDTIALIGFVLVLFVLLAGFNRQQVEKHNQRLEEHERRKKEKEEENNKNA